MDTRTFDYAVFIGRIQPLHSKHLEHIRRGLSVAKNLILFIGSSHCSRSIQNPFSFQEREQMVRSCLSIEENARTIIVPSRDRIYNDNEWLTAIQNSVFEITDGQGSVVLLGTRKDESSFYLDLFPRWQKNLELRPKQSLNATDIRKAFFSGVDTFSEAIASDLKDKIPAPVLAFLETFSKTPAYAYLCDEYANVCAIKAKWASAPYEPTFITTDAVCVSAGHVLMVRRKHQPGKGMLALPGGYLQSGKRIFDSAIEELKEETRIKIPREDLKRMFVADGVFDHPGRSPRGRIVTHAFLFDIPSTGHLPEVRGGDDAERAVWVALSDLYRKEEEVFEDHLSIVDSMLGKLKR